MHVPGQRSHSDQNEFFITIGIGATASSTNKDVDMCKIVKMYCTKCQMTVGLDTKFCGEAKNGIYCEASVRGRPDNKPKAVKRKGTCNACTSENCDDDDNAESDHNPVSAPRRPRSRRSRQAQLDEEFVVARSGSYISRTKYDSLPVLVRMVLNLTGNVRAPRSGTR